MFTRDQTEYAKQYIADSKEHHRSEAQEKDDFLHMGQLVVFSMETEVDVC